MRETLNQHDSYETIEVPVLGLQNIEFKEYDKFFLNHYKIIYNFKNVYKQNSNRRCGLVLSIDKDNQTATILTTERVAEYIQAKELSVYITRSKEKKLLYLFSNCSAVVSVDIPKLEIENYTNLINQDKSLE